MSKTINDTIQVMLRASEALRLSIQTDRELRVRIESQSAQIKVALGYLQAGRSDLAKMALTDEKPSPQPISNAAFGKMLHDLCQAGEPETNPRKCPECGGEGYTETEYGPIRCEFCSLGRGVGA